MKRTHSILLLFAVMCGLCCFPLACQRGEGGTTIKFWNLFTGPDGNAMREMVRRFNEENPDVTVRMQRINYGTYYNKLILTLRGHRAPDLFILHMHQLPRFAQAGYLLDLNPLVEASEGMTTDDFYGPTAEKCVSDGVRHALPLDVHTFAVYYNADLFRELGIVDENGDPKLPHDGASFIETAKRLTRDTDGDGENDTWGFAFAGGQDQTRMWLMLSKQAGGDVWPDDASQSRVNSPEGVAALKLMTSWVHDPAIAIAPLPQFLGGWLGFRQGRVGMIIHGIYMLNDLKRAKAFDYGTFPIPRFFEHDSSWGNSHVLAIKRDIDPEKKEATWRLLKYLSDNSYEWGKEGGQLPARNSVRESQAFRDLPYRAAFSAHLDNLALYPMSVNFAEMGDCLNEAMDDAFLLERTPQEALDRAHERILKIHARRAGK